MAKPEASDESAEPNPIYGPWELRIIVLGLSLPNFAAAFDSTALPVALPVITQDLGGTAYQAFWSGTTFLVASTVAQPVSCLLSEIFGLKLALTVCLVLFLFGSVLAAISHDFTLMLAARSIQGTGAGTLTALTSVLLADQIDLRGRGKWTGIVNTAHTLGLVSGPILSAAFSQSSASWRWIFWINLPLTGIGIFVVLALLEWNFSGEPVWAKLREADYLGIILFASSLTALMIGISWGGVLYDWNSWRTVLPLVIGLIGLVTFMIHEIYGAKRPFIPPLIFANHSTCINFFGIFAFGAILWALLYYLTLYYEGVKQFSMIHSGVALLPETLTVVPVGVAVSVLISVVGRYRWALWPGWIFSTLGLGLLMSLKVDTSVAGWVWPNLVVGLGTGMVYPAIQLGIQASAPDKVMAMAVTMISCFRNLGRSMGVAVGGVVLQNRLKDHLQREPLLASKAQQYTTDLSNIPQLIKGLGDSPAREALRVVLSKALSNVWAFFLGLAGLALLSTLFIASYDMGRVQSTKRGHNTR